MSSRIIRLLLLITLVGGMAGCQQSGVRPDVDTEDNTGQMGQESVAGAGDVYVRLAVGYMQDGRLGVALKKARHALQVDPDMPRRITSLRTLCRLGEPGLAERQL